jgi:hypothetical protein
MLDNFFLLYANKLFKDNPINLKVLFQDFIEQRHSMNKAGGIYNEWDVVRLEFLIDTIGAFSNCSEFDSALKLKDQIKSKAQELFEKKFYDKINSVQYVDVAFEAVFFYRYGWCDGTWHENGSCIGFRSDQHDFGLDDNVRLKCHECRQLFFRGMLMDFVSDKDFFELDLKNLDNYPFATLFDKEWVDENFPDAKSVIVLHSADPKSFDHYVSTAYDCVEIRAHATKRHVVKEESFSLSNLFDDKLSIYPLFTRFNDYLISVVGYSLVEFLRKNDYRKLKHCSYCNNFFIAKSINRNTRCYSKDCEKVYQRDKKRKQREKEPDIYY